MIRETIKKEMAIRGEKPSELARKVGMHTAPLYNYLHEKAGLSYRVLEKICEVYDLVLIKKF
jgi:transcriptional regulator with XRE-family HTH domain